MQFILFCVFSLIAINIITVASSTCKATIIAEIRPAKYLTSTKTNDCVVSEMCDGCSYQTAYNGFLTSFTLKKVNENEFKVIFIKLNCLDYYQHTFVFNRAHTL